MTKLWGATIVPLVWKSHFKHGAKQCSGCFCLLMELKKFAVADLGTALYRCPIQKTAQAIQVHGPFS